MIREVQKSTQFAGFLHRYQPAQNPQETETLLMLHGTGGDESDLLPLAEALKPGAGVLSPRGRVLENGMPRFFRRLAEGVFDLEDLRVRTDELATFLTESVAQYGFDPGKIVAVGYSNGANIAGSLLLRRPGTLAKAVLLHPMVPFEPETLPDLRGVPIFIGAGQNDPIVPIANTKRLVEILEASGAVVTVFWHNGGHSLTAGEVEAAREWLDR